MKNNRFFCLNESHLKKAITNKILRAAYGRRGGGKEYNVHRVLTGEAGGLGQSKAEWAEEPGFVGVTGGDRRTKKLRRSTVSSGAGDYITSHRLDAWEI